MNGVYFLEKQLDGQTPQNYSYKSEFAQIFWQEFKILSSFVCTELDWKMPFESLELIQFMQSNIEKLKVSEILGTKILSGRFLAEHSDFIENDWNFSLVFQQIPSIKSIERLFSKEKRIWNDYSGPDMTPRIQAIHSFMEDCEVYALIDNYDACGWSIFSFDQDLLHRLHEYHVKQDQFSVEWTQLNGYGSAFL
ncbi:MAG: hypothetical protein IPO40_20745 [Fibrobacteres bacterium]|nr:hypothetical protein [Fibrobacterota bacterium]